MNNSEFQLNELKEIRRYLEPMINAGEKQGIQNISVLKILDEVLMLMEMKILNGSKVESTLINQFNKVYGSCFRWFEGTMIEEKLDKLEDILGNAR